MSDTQETSRLEVALVADSLCCGQAKRMMRKPDIQIGNSNSKSSNKFRLKETAMKKASIWCLLALLSLVSVTGSETGAGTEKAVAALEQQWLEGQKTNNPDLVAPLLADKIVVTEADGKVNDKAGTLAFYKNTKWDSAAYDDVKVTVFGDTAIATGGFKGKGTDAMGKPFDNNERWTDTWMKMPTGKWQCVASQATPLKM
jgi:ketosteroid isomerase-like protein